MNYASKILLPVFILLLVACKGHSDTETTVVDDSTTIQSFINTVQPIELNDEFIDTAGYTNSEVEVAEKIEEKYGVQWDFCDCIVKNDSIEKAIMATEDDDELTLILDRSEVIDNHCKELLTAPNTTPEERAQHERKVKKCLKEAKR